MSETASIRARIKRILIDRLFLEGLEPEGIGDEDPIFGEGLGLDSVDALELVLGIEQEFGFKVKSDEMKRESFANVAALAEFVEQRLATASEPSPGA